MIKISSSCVKVFLAEVAKQTFPTLCCVNVAQSEGRNSLGNSLLMKTSHKNLSQWLKHISAPNEDIKLFIVQTFGH